MAIKMNVQNARLKAHELDYIRPLVESANRALHERSGAGSEMLGWLDLPETYDR